MYKDILVALDLEQNCHNVIEKAVEIAKINPDAKLHFVYISQMVVIESSYEMGNSSVVTPADTQANHHLLKEIVDNVTKLGIHADGEIIKGINIANTLLDDVYEKYHYDLIICGSNNKSELVEIFLGSVSAKIADKAKTDVYIVK